ncbi:hypothetical protein D3C79_272800 [compost metagenome]
MAAVAVQQPPHIAFAGYLAPDCLLVQQFQSGIAIAPPVGLLVFQRTQLFRVQRGEDTAGAIVAGDGVLIDAVADNLRAFEHHAAKHGCGICAVTRLDHIDIAAVGVDYLTAVAAAGAPTDTSSFQHHHVKTGLDQVQRRRQAGKTSANDADVAADIFVQHRVGRERIGGGGIIAGNVFRHDSSARIGQKVVGVCALTIRQTRADVLLKLWGMPVLMA